MADRAVPDSDRRFGAVLDHYRLRHGLSCKQLAELAGVDRSYVDRLRRGGRGIPRRPTVIALAEALGSTAEERRDLFTAAGYLDEEACCTRCADISPADLTMARLRLWGLGQLEEGILRMLIERMPDYVSPEAFAERLATRPEYVRARVWKLKAKLPEGWVIQNVRTDGYRLVQVV